MNEQKFNELFDKIIDRALNAEINLFNPQLNLSVHNQAVLTSKMSLIMQAFINELKRGIVEVMQTVQVDNELKMIQQYIDQLPKVLTLDNEHIYKCLNEFKKGDVVLLINVSVETRLIIESVSISTTQTVLKTANLKLAEAIKSSEEIDLLQFAYQHTKSVFDSPTNIKIASYFKELES